LYEVLTGGRNSELYKTINGIRIQISEMNLDVIYQRIGASFAALVAVNIIGTFFAASPSLLGLIALVAGALRPNWIDETLQEVMEILDQAKARGRGEKRDYSKIQTRKESKSINRKPLHYFVKTDGTKRWYRTGQSTFFIRKGKSIETNGMSNFFRRKHAKDNGLEENWWDSLFPMK